MLRNLGSSSVSFLRFLLHNILDHCFPLSLIFISGGKQATCSLSTLGDVSLLNWSSPAEYIRDTASRRHSVTEELNTGIL